MGASALLFQGQRELRTGNAPTALATLESAASLLPDSPHVALHRALALAEADRLDDALAALGQAALRWPRNPVFPLFRGGLLAEADRLDEATSALEAAQRLSPGNRLAEAYLALVAMRRGEVERPLRRLAAAGMTDNPRALAALLAEVEAALFRRFGPDSDGSPPHAPEAEAPARARRMGAERLAAIGRTRLEHGDPAGAWPLLKLAAEKNPSLPDLYALLGFAAYDLGRHEAALDFLARAGSWAQAIEAVHLHRGACLYKLGRFAEAMDALRAAEAADRLGDYTAWIQLYLARVLVALGRVPDARAPLRRLFELEGDLALARLRQARELLGLAIPQSAPQGYEVISEGKTILVVKPVYAEAISSRLPHGAARAGGEGGGGTGILPVSATGGTPVPPLSARADAPSGRAPMQRFALSDGTALIRSSRRGGLFGKLLGDKHFDGNRFLREIAVSEALRRRGIPTPEIIAGIRHEVFPGIYRAEIIVREIPDSLDLAAALRPYQVGEGGCADVGGTGVPPVTHAKRETRDSKHTLSAAASLLRQVHDSGLFHPDLNARNILIAPDGSAMILDLDRAELLDELPLSDRIANLARLYRSLHKLGLAPDPVSDADWTAFYAAYAAGDESLLRLSDAVLSRCHRDLRRHKLWWRIGGRK